MSAEFGRYAALAGLRRIRLYDLRQQAATILLAQGVPPRVVMEILGHSTYRLTMDTYAHVMPHLLTEARDAIERAYGGQ